MPTGGGTQLRAAFRSSVEGRRRPLHWRGDGRRGDGRRGGRMVIGDTSRMSSSESVVAAGEAGGRLEGTIEQQQPGVAVVEENGESRPEQNGGGSQTAADVSTHGFNRAEMFSQPLVGSVSYYERHVFLCFKDPGSWPSNVEAAEFDLLPNSLASALRARKADMAKKTRLTVCAGLDGVDSSAGDVLIFPDMVRYRGLTHEDAVTFVEDTLVKEKMGTGSALESLSGSHIFVCSHATRDRRCGTCGPVLVERLHEEIKLRGLESQIFVRACSHFGGHKYAGNVIVFSSTGSEGVAGHWYGYVSPADVPLILDLHIAKGEIIDRLWRGQMGANVGDQKLGQQKRMGRLQDERGDSRARSQSPSHGTNRVKDCCSGSAGCQSSALALEENRPIPDFLASSSGSRALALDLENRPIPDCLVSAGSSGHMVFDDDHDSEADEAPMDPRIPLWGPYYIPLPKWFSTWEKEDTNATLAVVGAAAAVAIAIRVCRESGSA